VFRNTGRLPLYTHSKPSQTSTCIDNKNHLLCQEILTTQADIYAIAEHGLNFSKLSPEDQWKERTLGKLPSAHLGHFSWNKNDPWDQQEARQWGGTGIIAMPQVTPHIIEKSNDKTKLGRWTTLLLQGKQGHRVRLITGYRPHKLQSGLNSGEQTVAAQHQRFFRSQGRELEPQEAFIQDLDKEIEGWLQNGEELVIALDANEDVRSGATNTMLTQHGLKEAILDKHSHLSAPATVNSNHSRTPIDGIWTTAGLTIQRAGYGAQGEGYPSDHRLLYIDIHTRSLYGYRPPTINHTQISRLHSQDPRTRRKYLRAVRRLFDRGKLLQLQSELDEMIRINVQLPVLEAKYNELARYNATIRFTAEKQTRKLRMGGVPYSPQIQGLRNKIALGQAVLKIHWEKAISRKKIWRLQKACNEPQILEWTKTEVEAYTDRAMKSYMEAKTHAPSWRLDHLNALAQAIASDKQSKKKSVKRDLINIEKTRAQHRRISAIVKKHRGGKVTKVLVCQNPDTNHEIVRELTDQDAIEKACTEEGIARHTQSKYTPFHLAPLYDDLGPYPTADKVLAILEGRYEPPPYTNIYAARLLQALAYPPQFLDNHGRINPSAILSATITSKEHKTQWKRKKETTKAEPSGLSFSHYKAGTYDDDLLSLDLFLRNIPREHGFSPQSWQVITDFMILKKQNVYRLDKMRIIQLMHSEFNANNQIDGRRMMANAEKHNSLDPNQMGSRKHHEAAKARLTGIIAEDILRQRAMAGCRISNDAKSCYDRINHIVAFLAMARQGVAYTALVSLFQTLQLATHHILTGFGRSNHIRTYGTKQNALLLLSLAGIGQGNGAGPAIWAVISVVILQILREEQLQATFISAITKKKTDLPAVAYVDDTDLYYAATDTATRGEDLLPTIQKFLTLYQGLLRATGGELKPSKSHWYLIDWKWDGEGWTHKTIDEMPANLNVKKEESETTEHLTRKEMDDADTGLGIQACPTGSQEAATQTLLTKITDFARHMVSGKWEKNDAWLAVTTRIMRTINYPMRCTQLSRETWDKLMVPLWKTCLPRSGYARNFPRAVLYGPKDFLGLGIIHPWYHQELSHLQVCMEELNRHSLLSDMLHTSFEQLRLEIGYPGQLTEAPAQILALATTDCWTKSVWRFATEQGFQFTEKGSHLLRPARKGDEFLMKLFVDQGYDLKSLARLNHCRKYLQVITVADISTADGRHLLPGITHGTLTQPTWHNYLWPRRPPSLSATHWKLWQDALQQCIISTTTPSSGYSPRTKFSLGDWLVPIEEQWTSFFHINSDTLYLAAGGLWFSYGRTSSRSNPIGKTFYPLQQTSDTLPSACIMASIHMGRDTPAGVTLLNTYRPRSRLRTSIPHLLTGEAAYTLPCSAPSLLALRQTLPENQLWAIDTLKTRDEGAAVAHGIQQGTAVAVSDGTFREYSDTAAAAFVISPNIATIEGPSVIRGENQVPGDRFSHSSYRSELSGILGILHSTRILCHFHNVTSGAITIGLDNESAIEQAKGDWPISVTQPAWDLLQEIRHLLQLSPITCSFRWVKGHQDDFTAEAKLDNWARLNIDCDHRAKEFHNSLTTPRVHLQLPHEQWSLSLHGTKLTSFHLPSVYKDIYTYTETHYAKRHSLTDEHISWIAWEPFKRAIKRLPLGKQRWLAKHATGHCAVGRMELRRQHQDHSKCPRCFQEDETTLHVLQCTDHRATEQWNTALRTLAYWMETHHTNPLLHFFLIRALQHWHSPQALPVQQYHTDPSLLSFAQEQASIGWYNFLLGRVSSQIITIQAQYLRNKDTKMTGTSWTAGLITQLWDIQWSMWEHRNHIKHDPHHPWHQHTFEANLALVEAQFESGTDTLLPRDRHWLNGSPHTFRSKTNAQLEQWLTSVSYARNAYFQDQLQQNAALQQQQASMTNWLHQTLRQPNHSAVTPLSNPEHTTPSLPPAGETHPRTHRRAMPRATPPSSSRHIMQRWLQSAKRKTQTTKDDSAKKRRHH
jgi:hypothetical protein